MAIAVYGKHTERATAAFLERKALEQHKEDDVRRLVTVDPYVKAIREKRRAFDEQMERNRQAYREKLERERREVEERAAVLLKNKIQKLTDVRAQQIDDELEIARERIRSTRIFKVALRFACRRYGVSKTEILGKSNSRELVIARHCVMYWTRRLTCMSYSDIGRRLGDRDHTTAIFGVKSYLKKRALMGRYLRSVR